MSSSKHSTPQENLRTVFNYYLCLQKKENSSFDFDTLTARGTLLPLHIFMLFCKDYILIRSTEFLNHPVSKPIDFNTKNRKGASANGLAQSSSRKQQSQFKQEDKLNETRVSLLTKHEILTIFRKKTSYKQKMAFEEFVEVIEEMRKSMFSKEDEAESQNWMWSYLSVNSQQATTAKLYVVNQQYGGVQYVMPKSPSANSVDYVEKYNHMKKPNSMNKSKVEALPCIKNHQKNDFNVSQKIRLQDWSYSELAEIKKKLHADHTASLSAFINSNSYAIEKIRRQAQLSSKRYQESLDCSRLQSKSNVRVNPLQNSQENISPSPSTSCSKVYKGMFIDKISKAINERHIEKLIDAENFFDDEILNIYISSNQREDLKSLKNKNNL